MPYTTRLYKAPEKVLFPCKKRQRKPVQVQYKLKTSTLDKRWGKFLFIDYPRVSILRGHFAQSSKRYRPRTNGRQDAANCTVAVVFAKIFKMADWNSGYINKILDIGDGLLIQSLTYKPELKYMDAKPKDLYNNFYIDDIKITFTTAGQTTTGKLYQDYAGGTPDLKTALAEYLGNHESAVCAILTMLVAFWTREGFFYYFDPHERDQNGRFIRDGTGAACILRFTDVNRMVDSFCMNLDRSRNFKFTLLPINILRMNRVVLGPPENLLREPLNLREISPEEEEAVTMIKPPIEKPKPPEEISISHLPLDEIYEMNPDVVKRTSKLELNEEQRDQVAKMVSSKASVGKLPIELRPELVPSITYFDTSDKLFGILRGSTFKRWELGPPIVLMSIVMLKVHKSRVWIPEIIDGILHFGHKLYKESARRSIGDRRITLKDIVTDFEVYGTKYTTDICHTSVIGQLKSRKNNVPDLLLGLADFFKEYDCGIIQGPVLVSVWQEDGLYYMFDPCERDEKGCVKEPFKGESAELQEIHDQSGKACVTWFKVLGDLVKLYSKNVPHEKRFDQFFISRVLIYDYIEVPEDWFEFFGVRPGKWILRGSFHQNSSRFEEESRNSQCTAMMAVALAFAKLQPAEEWDSSTVDKVLMEGDVLYNSTVAVLQETNKYQHPHLMIDEIIRSFTLSEAASPHTGKRVNLDIMDCLVNGIITARDNDEQLNLKQACELFFAEYDAGVLTARGISVAIWRENSVYYYFDSHSRDPKGLYHAIGTSCLLRILKIDDLAWAIQTNLRPGPQDIFNISYVGASIWVTDSSGIVKPPLNEFKEVDNNSAILRGSHHEGDLRFDMCRNKQTLSMCLTALGTMKIMPAGTWSVLVMDEILKIGNRLHELAYTKQLLADDKFEDPLDLTMVETSFRIGDDHVEITIGDPMEGTYEDDTGQNVILETLATFFEEQVNPDEPDLNKCAVFSSAYMTAAIWVEYGIYYIYESKERDKCGNNFDRDTWSVRVTPSAAAFEGEGEGEDEDGPMMPPPDESEDSVEVDEEPEEEEIEEAPFVPPVRSHPNGYSYVKWCCTLDSFAEHIISNAPPNHLQETEFTLTHIIVETQIIDKSKNMEEPPADAPPPEEGAPNFYGGPWYNFDEVQYGYWIIRGTMCQCDPRFPELNRGHQDAANAIAFYIFQKTIQPKDWKSKLVDVVLKYGDKLHTYCLKKRRKQLAISGLSGEALDNALCKLRFEPKEIAKEYCLGEYQYEVSLEEKILIGEITAADDYEEVYSLKRGLETCFHTERRLIINLKSISLAVWKGEKMYYMFDPNCRGPNGTVSSVGVACLLRFLSLTKLAEVLKFNMDVEGSNRYTVDKIRVAKHEIQKHTEVGQLKIPEEPPRISAFQEVTPGRLIVVGTISQEDERFGRGKNVQSSSCAIVALGMTYLHKPTIWTKEIIDEVVITGDQLYGLSADKLGFDFNPWEEQLSIRKVNKEFYIGINQLTLEIVERNDQKGMLDTKQEDIMNLRQGVERFFANYNTHGVLQSDVLTVAIWKHEKCLFMFDPNPRGPTGITFPNGTACLLQFHNAQIMAEHFLTNIPKEHKMDEFVITPITIHVVKNKSKGRKKDGEKKEPTQSRSRLTERAAEHKHGHKKSKKGSFPKTWVQLKDPDASILIAGFSQGSTRFSPRSRGFQAAANAVVAIVMFQLNEPSMWTTDTMNSILMSGDQLYKDSYLYYKPESRIVNLQTLLRRFFVEKYRVQITLYKPCIVGNLTEEDIMTGIHNFFLQERAGILGAKELTMTIFQKGGQYYLFDPYDRDHNGNPVMEHGKACLMRFRDLIGLAVKILSNLSTLYDVADNQYELSAVQIKDITFTD